MGTTLTGMTTDKPIAPDDRSRLDQVFMQVVLDVQAQVQQTAPAPSTRP